MLGTETDHTQTTNPSERQPVNSLTAPSPATTSTTLAFRLQTELILDHGKEPIKAKRIKQANKETKSRFAPQHLLLLQAQRKLLLFWPFACD
jgi:hypothetical protein